LGRLGLFLGGSRELEACALDEERKCKWTFILRTIFTKGAGGAKYDEHERPGGDAGDEASKVSYGALGAEVGRLGNVFDSVGGRGAELERDHDDFEETGVAG